MSTVYPTMPRLSVRDSFDEDDLSDVDDEVFIRDGKNGGLKLDDEGGVKRPLMAPRRKTKTGRINGSPKLPCRALFAPFCYGLLALLVLLGLIVACIYTVNLFPVPLSILRNWLSGAEPQTSVPTSDFVVPCTSLSSTIVWTRTVPKFTSEAPFRGNDVNGDKVEDVIVGFSTGLDAIDATEYLCDLYFGGQKPCLGGIMALDGKSGDTLWIYWTSHAIFNVDCGMDITGDGVNDCLITGRGGILHAVDGSLGANIWKLDEDEESIVDVYDAAYMSDVDGDSIGDVVASHTAQYGESHSSEVLVISGKRGNIISRVDVPRNEELFIAPRPLLHPDGEIMLVLVSSTPEKSGGLYVVSYNKLIYGNLQFHELYWGKGRGILLPPILTDITSDGTEDIIVATVNATIAAFDGLTLRPLWNYTVAGSEIISVPIPGYYDDDDVPDFMVKHQVGPGYPLYYYTVSTILNGRNGTPMLEKPLVDSLSGQMSGLSVSVDDYGNDWFLHWSSNCLNHEGAHEKYQFLQGQSLLSQSRADICRLLYNATLVTRLWALSQHVEPPGQSLYYSEDWRTVEYNNSLNPREEADKYLRDRADNYNNGLSRVLDAGLSLVSERSPRIDKTHRKSSSFRHKMSQTKNVEIPDDFFVKQVVDAASPADDENGELESYKEADNFNAKSKTPDVSWNEWRDAEIQREKQYDTIYEDPVDPSDPAESLRVSDIREQRSDSGDSVESSDEVRRVNGSRGNQYDPNMDYTNGGSRYDEYPPPPSLSVDVPSLIDAEVKEKASGAEKKRRKRPGFASEPRRGRHSDESRRFDEELANIERVFKRQSTRNYYSAEEREARDAGESRRKRRASRRDESAANKGIQRQPPTGILLPSISRSIGGRTSIDLVFSTYWLPPSQVSLLLLQQDLDCIRARRSRNPGAFEANEILAECLAERGIDYKLYQEGTSRENVKIPLGQMTVYRMRLECNCPDDMLPGMPCKNISQHQSWSAHLGESGNGFFRPLRKTV